MWEFFKNILNTSDFPARWQCGNWTVGHGWLHILSDLAIFGAYFAIPVVLAYFALRRKDVPFQPTLWLFVGFILLCGVGHLVEATIFWQPWYRLSGVVKMATGIVSWVTVIALSRVIPIALEMPAIARLNEQLLQEIRNREQAQRALQEAHDLLEERVQERTRELREANEKLLLEVQERQKTERALEEKTRMLERSNTDLEQFAYIASHDLKEPLRAVAGCVGLLADKYKGQLDETADTLLQHSIDGAHRMQTLIDDLLAYSRVGSRGKRFEAVDLQNLVEESQKELVVAIEESGATLEVKDLPTIQGDETQLYQLFLNLLSNAIKFRDERKPHIVVSARRGDNEWLVSVQDNGIGIDEKHFQRVFQIFQRLHTRDVYPGTGMGLAICKKIVDRHHGRIWLESTVGKGTTFFLAFPDNTDTR